MEDGAWRRRLRKGLPAGGLDTDGQGRHPVTGTPPGGTVSPVLAQVCLHDVRDVWVAKGVQRHWRGAAWLLR
jgi:RNA-directed DNA polymerase